MIGLAKSVWLPEVNQTARLALSLAKFSGMAAIEKLRGYTLYGASWKKDHFALN